MFLYSIASLNIFFKQINKQLRLHPNQLRAKISGAVLLMVKKGGRIGHVSCIRIGYLSDKYNDKIYYNRTLNVDF